MRSPLGDPKDGKLLLRGKVVSPRAFSDMPELPKVLDPLIILIVALPLLMMLAVSEVAMLLVLGMDRPEPGMSGRTGGMPLVMMPMGGLLGMLMMVGLIMPPGKLGPMWMPMPMLLMLGGIRGGSPMSRGMSMVLPMLPLRVGIPMMDLGIRGMLRGMGGILEGMV